MATNCLNYCFVFILFVIAAVNANLRKILSDELIAECQKYEDTNNGIHRCLKNEIKVFCENDGDISINGTFLLNNVEEAFCILMENGKRNKKLHRRQKQKHNKFIPSSVKQKCFGIDLIDDDNTEDDCIQEELKNYCKTLEPNSTALGDDTPFGTPICSCYSKQGKRNMKQCIKEQKKEFCLVPENKETFECRRMKKCGHLGGLQFRSCVKTLCNEENSSDNFGCQRMKCVKGSNNRKDKQKCLQTLCQNGNNLDEPLCLKIKDKVSRKANRKMLRQAGKVWRNSKSPIPRVVKKMCRDEDAEGKDDCILQKLEDTCRTINETIGIGNNEACKCIGSSEYPETIDGLRSCVKSHMLNYCQDDNNEDMEKKFECQKLEKCEDVKGGNRLRKRQCIKKLCKDEMFAETCHCKSGRKERRKCFRKLEKVELEN